MAGRVLTFQTQPFECSTNYVALVAMRCNVDVQDLRRVLPPWIWMRHEDLEPEAREELAKYPICSRPLSATLEGILTWITGVVGLVPALEYDCRAIRRLRES